MAVRVLVADDTEHVRRMLADLLALDGFDVVATAADGEEAAALAGEADPDVVVMDLRMPVLDGLDATRRIRAERPGQIVLLYTAYLDPTIEAAAREVGVSLCVGKQSSVESLEREISRLTLHLLEDTGRSFPGG